MGETAENAASVRGRDISSAASKMFALELVAPRREEDAVISTRTEAAKRIGCSAYHRGRLAAEAKIADAGRTGASGMPGDGCLRQPLGSGSGLADEPERYDASVARIVQSVIEGV